MHDYKILACSLIFLFLFFIIPHVLAVELVPVEPSEGHVFNSTNNFTLTCNASYGDRVLNLSLYHNLNGTFSLNQTEYYETSQDENTTFLCRFDNTSSCYGLGSGTPYVFESASFSPGIFSYDVRINDTTDVRYATQGNFNRIKGTIEFWVRPMSDISGQVGYLFQAADNGQDDINQLEIYYNSGTLYSEINDIFYARFYDFGDISSWLSGEWHHVAVVWDLNGDVGNGAPIELYIDGVPQDNYQCEDPSYQCNIPVRYYYTSSTFYIGSAKGNGFDMNSSSQADVAMDEFRISNVVRNDSEINETHFKGIGDYSSVSKSWSFLDVQDGSYSWNCIAYDSDLQSNATQIRNFYVDMQTPPEALIYLSPNNSDDIDPGVTINVTANVTDPSGVSTVIFQWKEAGEGSWNSKTMAYNASSGLYWNASFQTIPNDASIYYYRILSNDTGGRSGYSPTQDITSEWDYTWTREPASFGTVHGLINSISNVGMLTINNTGDRTLNFTLSNNWPLDVYYNGSESSNFYIANHTKATINITAMFASSDSENDMTLTINASHYLHTPSPVSLSTNATINSYSGGPYLTVSITEYTSIVYQSQTFNLSARLKNIGNDTAEYAWINWSLPAGWTNISGNISQIIGNLSSGSSFTSNLTITVDPSSASPGTFIIYANSSCSQNISGMDSKTVGVECSDSDGVCGYGCSYVNDKDCGIPVGAQGTSQTVYLGGGGGGEKTQYLISLEAPSSFDIQRGERKNIKVEITNGGKSTNLTSIYLLVTGYPLSQIKADPSIMARLEYNQSGLFDMEFFAPNYTAYGIHNITITAKGLGSIGTSRNFTDVQSSAKVSMVVHSSRENETLSTLSEAEKAVQEMADAGLSTREASSLLEQAKSQISGWDYDTALDTSKQVLDLRDKAFRITSMVNQVEEGVRQAESFGIQAPESKMMAELSKSALQREDYAKAEERASSAVSAFVIEGQWLENMKFLYANWQFIIPGSALFAGAIYLAYRKSLKGRLRKRIELAEEEEKATKKLMEKAQEEMYKDRTLSKLEYHKLMSEHESKLAKIRKRKAQLTRRMISLEKRSAALSDFRKQEDSLKSEIKEIQRKYYEQGTVSKSSYSKSMGELREELAESIKNIDMIMERRKE